MSDGRAEKGHDFEAGNMREPILQTLAMLGPISAPTDDEPNDYRGRHNATKHIMPLGRLVDDLLYGNEGKIKPLMG